MDFVPNTSEVIVCGLCVCERGGVEDCGVYEGLGGGKEFDPLDVEIVWDCSVDVVGLFFECSFVGEAVCFLIPVFA